MLGSCIFNKVANRSCYNYCPGSGRLNSEVVYEFQVKSSDNCASWANSFRYKFLVKEIPRNFLSPFEFCLTSVYTNDDMWNTMYFRIGNLHTFTQRIQSSTSCFISHQSRTNSPIRLKYVLKKQSWFTKTHSSRQNSSLVGILPDQLFVREAN